MAAVDGDPQTSWSSKLFPVQSLQVTLDKFYLVDRIEMVVEQAPAGETSHQIWIGGASGVLTKFYEFVDVPTTDGQTLSLPGESTSGAGPSDDPDYEKPQLGRLERGQSVWRPNTTAGSGRSSTGLAANQTARRSGDASSDH